MIAGGGLWLVKERYAEKVQMHSEGASYYCPMHPTYTSDRPGDCPICNMKLVKKDNASQGTVNPSSVCVRHNCKMANCPMEMVAKPGTKANCPVCGEVIVAPTGEWKKILYWTDPMMPDFKSDKPGKSPMGMELIPVYEEDTALQEGASGAATFFVSPEKQQLIGVKTETVEKKVLTKEIRTTGIVSHHPERLTLPATEIPDTVWIFASLYDYEWPWVKVGDKATVEAGSYAGETFPGVVKGIGTRFDPATRSIRATLEVQNIGKRLMREMQVTVKIHAVQGEKLVVPSEAVLDTGERQLVFVVKGEGSFEPRPVHLGLRSEEFVEVLHGLSEGETIVTSSTFLIDSESRLKSVVPTGEHQH